MWHPPSADIWANLPTGLTNNWDSRRDLDTGLWHPLIPLSPPLPDVWHPVIFLWPFHAPTSPPYCHCVHCSQILTQPTLQCAMSAPGPSLASTLSSSLLQLYYTFSTDDPGPPHMFDHLWPTAALLPTAQTISRNLYMLLQFSPTLYSSSYFVSSARIQRHIK